MNPAFGYYDDEPIRVGRYTTPDNADLFPFPRRCGQGFGHDRETEKTRRVVRSSDSRGFIADSTTSFLADAFIRNSTFAHRSRPFSVCSYATPLRKPGKGRKHR